MPLDRKMKNVAHHGDAEYATAAKTGARSLPLLGYQLSWTTPRAFNKRRSMGRQASHRLFWARFGGQCPDWVFLLTPMRFQWS